MDVNSAAFQALRLSEIQNHIDFARKLISSTNFDLVTRSRLEDLHRALLQRVDDSHLRLAVVGEASTGKSTFINALLRDNLLCAHALTMTTSAATCIEHGKALAVTLKRRISNARHSRDEKTDQAIVLTEADEPIILTEVFGSHPASGPTRASLRQTIHWATSNEDVAQTLQDILIHHPASFLTDNIRVIDTPGTNALNPRHAQVTRDAVRDSDVAIVITSASKAATDSLVKWLSNDLGISRLLHRCTFLITAMDRIRPQEREKVIRYTRRRIESLDLPSPPTILTSSAQSVVDGFSTDAPEVEDEAERSYWQDRFIALEADIRANLQRSRAVLIAERFVRLMDDLLAALGTHLSALQETTSTKRDALEASIIPDLNSFADNQRNQLQQELLYGTNDSLAVLDVRIGNQRRKLLDEVCAAIAAVQSADELKSYIQDRLPDRVRSYGRVELLPCMDPLESRLSTLEHSFDRDFSAAYHRLPVISGAPLHRHNPEPTASLDPGEILAGIVDEPALAVPTLEERLIGAAIGGLLGLAFGGFGAIAGAALGSQIQSWLGPTIEERKKKVWESTRALLLEHFATLERGLRGHVRTCADHLSARIEDRIDSHVRAYRETVDEIREQYARETNHLKNICLQMEADLREIQRRRDEVRARLKELRWIHTA